MYSHKSKQRPPPFVSLFRGLYTRVARKLEVDPSYVSRVARGERKSDAVEAALSAEIGKIFKRTENHDGNHSSKTSRATAKTREAAKEAAKVTLATVKKEMARPRFAKSAGKEETNLCVTKPGADSRPELVAE